MEINIFDDTKNKFATVRIVADSPAVDQMLEKVLAPVFLRVERGADLSVICLDAAPSPVEGPCIFIGSSPDSLGNDQIFLSRPFSVRALFQQAVELVRRCSEREIASGFGAVGDDALYFDRRISLTPREAQLFRLLLSRQGECVSRSEIDSALWGEGVGNCADVYVCYLRKKLEKIAGPGVLLSVRGRGYMLKKP
ncbi:MAG: winged helix-turn-helix domain-containing protein [Clostridia bacterium]|nr:winged helix-turn-helix domain-containing protein [Clostridia bacterium]